MKLSVGCAMKFLLMAVATHFLIRSLPAALNSENANMLYMAKFAGLFRWNFLIQLWLRRLPMCRSWLTNRVISLHCMSLSMVNTVILMFPKTVKNPPKNMSIKHYKALHNHTVLLLFWNSLRFHETISKKAEMTWRSTLINLTVTFAVVFALIKLQKIRNDLPHSTVAAFNTESFENHLNGNTKCY